jgi:hypothetical protein
MSYSLYIWRILLANSWRDCGLATAGEKYLSEAIEMLEKNAMKTFYSLATCPPSNAELDFLSIDVSVVDKPPQ